MKKILLLFVVIAFQVLLCAETSEKVFTGTIEQTLKITMTLKFEGNQVSGTYFYDTYKKPIALKGTIDDQKNILINELDDYKKVKGIFKGTIAADNKIEGTWSTPDGQKKKAFMVEQKREAQTKAVGWAIPISSEAKTTIRLAINNGSSPASTIRAR